MKNIISGLACFLTFLIFESTGHAQNVMVTYQGRVTDSGTNFTGTGEFEFALVISTNATHQALATANPPSGGFITVITVNVPGNGYTSTPAVTILGGGGTGATAHATISSGAVTSIIVDNPGHGYASTPAVSIAPPPANISYTTYWSNDGTASGGSEPLSGVNIGVSNGLFTVLLGDTTVLNMAAIPASLFSQPGLELRIWFSDGAQGFAALDPATPLTSVPYAANVPGLSVQQNSSGAPNVLAGSPVNYIAPGVIGAVVAGGGSTNAPSQYQAAQTNSVTGDFGTVSGGGQNLAGGPFSTVTGGSINSATGQSSTVGGGSWNTASGDFSTVAGGYGNNASGVFSFASGVAARATNYSSFVWADASTNSFALLPFSSQADYSFNVRATGGFYFCTGVDSSGNVTSGVRLLAGANAWSSLSDRNAKKNFQPVDGQSILDKLASIPIQRWNYKWESDKATPNIGPMAQDFKSAFYPGRDDKSISTLEFDGVELAAIQGLNEKLKEKDADIRALQARLDKLERLLAKPANH